MTLNAIDIYNELVGQKPTPLKLLPHSHGIYALWDHKGKIRYFGITESEAVGFYERINNRHVSGSECYSHKFSQAYCTGRMWRNRNKLNDYVAGMYQSKSNAAKSKALRNYFIREYCAATFCAIARKDEGTDYLKYLESLETEIKHIAPTAMRRWEGKNFSPVEEPVELVDDTIRRGVLDSKSRFSAYDTTAFDAQNKIYQMVSEKP